MSTDNLIHLNDMFYSCLIKSAATNRSSHSEYYIKAISKFQSNPLLARPYTLCLIVSVTAAVHISLSLSSLKNWHLRR